jgi:hypothetical protein
MRRRCADERRLKRTHVCADSRIGKAQRRLPMPTQNNQHELKVTKRAGCAARALAFFCRPPSYVRYQT